MSTISIILLLLLIVQSVYLLSIHRELRLRRSTEHFIEDFLKYIFTSQREACTLEGVMEWSGLSEERVRYHLLIAQRRGWVTINGVHDDIIVPTEAGKMYGAQMSRAHRLYERYLAEQTGYPSHEWHDRAEEMEHALHPRDVEHLSRRLGDPVLDPHGSPIPTEGGRLPEVSFIRMDEAGEGSYTVASLSDKEADAYQWLTSKGVAIGSMVVIKDEGHRMMIRINGEGIEIPLEWQHCLLLRDESGESDNVQTLWSLQSGEKAVIIGLNKCLMGEKRRRLSDLGFVKGGEVSVYMKGPNGRPVAYLIRDTAIALRQDQAEHIIVKRVTSN